MPLVGGRASTPCRRPPIPPRLPRPARRRSSTTGRTPSSAPAAAGGWSARAAATPAATAARTPAAPELRLNQGGPSAGAPFRLSSPPEDSLSYEEGENGQDQVGGGDSSRRRHRSRRPRDDSGGACRDHGVTDHDTVRPVVP